MDVLLFDGYFCDLIITGLPEVPRLGTDVFGRGMAIHAGGTFHMVRALHRLGLRAGWVCDFGNDLFSQLVLSEIRQEGVDTSLFRIHDKPLRSLSLAFSFENDRGFISYIDPIEQVDRIPYVLENKPKAVFLSMLQVGPDLLALVAAARRVGAMVLMDCQATSATLGTPGVIEALGAIDVFLPNAGEAKQLAGASDVEGAARILSRYAHLVVVKLGAIGALAQGQRGKIYSPGIEVASVDTTGAGDCFNAGFLYSHLRGDSLEKNLAIGNICGGLSATAFGTIATPTEEQVLGYLTSAREGADVAEQNFF